MTLDDEPMPSTNRPGAAASRLAVCDASDAGPCVYTGMMAVPNRSVDDHCDATASGVNASVPSVSADQRSVYPRSSSSWIHSRCSANDFPASGTVMP